MAEAPTPGGADTLRTRMEFDAADVDDVDVDTIIGNILKGSCDGPRMNEVLKAIRDRLVATDSGLRWHVSLDGLDVGQEQLTLHEARLVQDLTRQPWLTIDPISDVKMTIAVLTALYAIRHDMTVADAAHKAEALSALQVAEAFSQRAVMRPFDGTSNPSSTSATSSGGGRRRSPKSNGSKTSAAS